MLDDRGLGVKRGCSPRRYGQRPAGHVRYEVEVNLARLHGRRKNARPTGSAPRCGPGTTLVDLWPRDQRRPQGRRIDPSAPVDFDEQGQAWLIRQPIAMRLGMGNAPPRCPRSPDDPRLALRQETYRPRSPPSWRCDARTGYRLSLQWPREVRLPPALGRDGQRVNIDSDPRRGLVAAAVPITVVKTADGDRAFVVDLAAKRAKARKVNVMRFGRRQAAEIARLRICSARGAARAAAAQA